MNKRELIEKAAENTGQSMKVVAAVLDAVLDTIQSTVADDGKVSIAGWGKFELAKRAARMARNPSTGEPITLAPTVRPVFRAGTGFIGLTRQKHAAGK
ncbi:transcriptional regulator [Planomonospora parontospora subsp. parontospora]|uniref:Transcriptional regulator n=2 Tax=Planomonospora parontospora TaxID=58119 RepID=A0AA37BM16_9ACTN|nr:HU family DNA-binding protein [Planomonospora parontospora]GGK90847.1 transcriptional regulator [Planomonospora parontospora]GII11945.1 transcriptional regulator [Planomonospora parontospora subsp. parontospora]